MPPLDDEDEIQEMPADTSTASIPSDEGHQATAESSTANGEPDRDTLSLVRDVVDKAASQSVAASPAEGQGTGEQPGAEEPKKEPSAEDFDGLPFSRHPRFRELINQRKDLLKQVEALKPLESDAQNYRQIDGFLKANSVPPEDAGLALTVVARSRLDPVGALEQLKPWLQDLMTRAGVILPPDIQQGIASGRFTQEVGLELSRARAQTQSIEQQRQTDAQQREEQRRVSQVRALHDTAASWESERRTKDPNFAAKLDPLMERVAFLQRMEGVPDTPDGVRAQLEKAYQAVNSRAIPALVQVRQRPAVRPVTGGQVSATARPAPQNTLDVIRQHVRVGA